MAKLTRVKRCLQLLPNANGRDLVVGDLHGHRGLLEQRLETIGFDPARDRVLSVGDLVDRGPDSLSTLQLIEQPWFHAVLGNHELMLLSVLGFYSSRVHARKSFASGGNEWISEAVARHRKTLLRLTERVAALPLSLHVAGKVPFTVMHGDLHPVGSSHRVLRHDETMCVHKAESTTLSRSNINDALRSDLLHLRFGQFGVHISGSPLAEMPLTYVGHSPVRHITVHNSYVYIDQGVCAHPSKQAAPTLPTVLDHTAFAYWLRGATRGDVRLTRAAEAEHLLAVA